MTLKKYVIFDIETTGLSPAKDQITEIGAVLVEEGNIIDRFQTFVSINGEVPPKIVELTGITDEMLEGQPSPDEALGEFLNYIGDLPIIAHNATFDVGFINQKLADNGYDPLSNDMYDTLKLSRELLKTIKRHNLGVLAQYLDVPNPGHHRADNDCEVLHGILSILMESLRRQGRSMEICKM